MMRITDYNNGIIDFCCECGVENGKKYIYEIISDNCALSIDVECPMCNSSRVLYLLICKTESKAKELSAELESLKYKRG